MGNSLSLSHFLFLSLPPCPSPPHCPSPSPSSSSSSLSFVLPAVIGIPRTRTDSRFIRSGRGVRVFSHFFKIRFTRDLSSNVLPCLFLRSIRIGVGIPIQRETFFTFSKSVYLVIQVPDFDDPNRTLVLQTVLVLNILSSLVLSRHSDASRIHAPPRNVLERTIRSCR